MKTYSTREVAKKLGLHTGTLARYVAVGKLPAPTVLKVGTASLHAWTEEEIEHVRQLLPKIANGRKTRYKKQSAASTQQSAKTKAPARVPVPQHTQRKPKKK
jgi:predicted DNA-binding transcriptional regulator AlpA